MSPSERIALYINIQDKATAALEKAKMSILKIELRQCRNMLGPALGMAACPYFQNADKGVCRSGCWEEPRCYTEEPPGGWQEQAKRDAWAAACWARDIARDARGNHGLVKAARDLTRRAERMAR